MNHGKPINSNLTKLRYIIGLYDDRKIQIYDKCQIYGIYNFIAWEGNWQIPHA